MAQPTNPSPTITFCIHPGFSIMLNVSAQVNNNFVTYIFVTFSFVWGIIMVCNLYFF